MQENSLVGKTDLGFHKKLTTLFVVCYFTLVLLFVGLGVALYVYPDGVFSEDSREVMIWLQGTLGPLIGMLTGALKDQLQFHFGSSVGSKTKD